MINPKTCIDLYDDGLQDKETDSMKRRNLKPPGQEITQVGAYSKEALAEQWKHMPNAKGPASTSNLFQTTKPKCP